MGKSNCEKQLEKMTVERDHWKRIAKQYASQLEEASRQLERNDIYTRAYRNGMATIDEDIHRLQNERDTARGEVDRLRGWLEWYEVMLPSELAVPPKKPPDDLLLTIEEDAWNNKTWPYTEISGALLFRNNATGSVERLTVPRIPFYSNLETARNTIVSYLLIAFSIEPSPQDMAGSLAGISYHEQRDIIAELNLYRQVLPDQYVAWKRKMFSDYWPQMEATETYETRSKGQQHWNDVIKRTLKKMDKRLKDVDIQATEDNQQNRLTDKIEETD